MSVFKQKILTLVTKEPVLRAEAVAWDCEDSMLVNPHKPIGLTPSPHGFFCYDCPLRAMGDAWILIAPPEKVTNYDTDGTIYYQWWFQKMDV